jgi:hypothetical protein
VEFKRKRAQTTLMINRMKPNSGTNPAGFGKICACSAIDFYQKA